MDRILHYTVREEENGLRYEQILRRKGYSRQCLAHLKQNSGSFLADGENRYQTQNAPCDFLDEDGNCCLGDCRPESCKKYPYTDQQGRWASLYSVLDVIEVCPVAFEIYERLKEEYGWRYRR